MSGLKAAPRAFMTHRPPLMAQRPKTVVGLDIDPVGITAAELGSAGRIAPDKTATLTLEPGIVRDGEILDVEALTHALKELYKLNKNLDRRVRVGLANQKIVVRTIEMPIIKDRKELAAAVRFQAADELPMPLDQAVLDWQPLETIETEAGVRQRVLLVAARRDMIDKVVAAVRGAGLRLEGIDLSAFGLIRALSVPGADSENANTEAVLYVAAGGLTNLAVARGMQCMFTRAAGGGVEAIAVDLAERRGLTLEHARGWLTYVGLDADITTLEGDAEIVAEARAALEAVENSVVLSPAGPPSPPTTMTSRTMIGADRQLNVSAGGATVEGAEPEVDRAGGERVQQVCHRQPPGAHPYCGTPFDSGRHRLVPPVHRWYRTMNGPLRPRETK